MVIEKKKIEVNGITLEYTIVDDMPDLDNDPYFQKQLEDTKAFFTNHPLPGAERDNKTDDKTK